MDMGAFLSGNAPYMGIARHCHKPGRLSEHMRVRRCGAEGFKSADASAFDAIPVSMLLISHAKNSTGAASRTIQALQLP
jgi:hypothetical protein